jgi:hypothetical protein
MKKLLVTGFLMLSLAAYSQKPAKLYTEVKQDTVAYYADNSEIYPVSITFTGQPELENLKIPGKV